MKRELRDQWVAALRSGEYDQGEGALLHIADNGAKQYCCLGVLNEIAETPCEAKPDEEGNVGFLNVERVREKWFSKGINDYYLASTLGLPAQLASMAAELNDNGNTFEEIADWTEENVPVED